MNTPPRTGRVAETSDDRSSTIRSTSTVTAPQSRQSPTSPSPFPRNQSTPDLHAGGRSQPQTSAQDSSFRRVNSPLLASNYDMRHTPLDRWIASSPAYEPAHGTAHGGIESDVPQIDPEAIVNIRDDYSHDPPTDVPNPSPESWHTTITRLQSHNSHSDFPSGADITDHGRAPRNSQNNLATMSHTHQMESINTTHTDRATTDRNEIPSPLLSLLEMPDYDRPLLLGDEVHWVDSSGNDETGAYTYTVTDFTADGTATIRQTSLFHVPPNRLIRAPLPEHSDACVFQQRIEVQNNAYVIRQQMVDFGTIVGRTVVNGYRRYTVENWGTNTRYENLTDGEVGEIWQTSERLDEAEN